MAKLNQIIALIPSKKANSKKVLEEAYHLLQKPPLFDGIARKYEPKDAEGDKLPPEQKMPQWTVEHLVKKCKEALSEMLDVVATQDKANTVAIADIVVDGKVLVPTCPVTHMLFLEKQLVDLHNFAEKIPTPDPSELWNFNGTAGYLETPPSQSTRTKKVPKNHIKYEATKEHPAQVETYHEDVLVGYWTTTKFSGAMAAVDKASLLKRIRKLQEAVKTAREEANSKQVEPIKEGGALLNYIFG